MHEGTIEMKDLLKDVKNEDKKLRIFVTELAQKLLMHRKKLSQ